MAHESLSISRPRLALEPWFLDAAFIALLLFSFVGFSPFAVRDPALLAAGGTATRSPDIVRQLCYFAVFAIIVTMALRRSGLRAFAALSLPLVLLLLWCVATALWAAEPGVTVRRAGLAFVVVISTVMSVNTLGPDRVLKLWRYVLIGVLLVNFVSIALIAQAVHLPGELDPKLVGNWRGLYFHKNIAGGEAAISAIVFFFFSLLTRRKLDMLLCAASVGFLAMTQSKSSLGLLPVAIALGLIYRAAWNSNYNRALVALGVVAATFLVGVLIALNYDAIASFLNDPTELTGRTAIWQAEFKYIASHPLLGSGFGSFADTGARSPLHAYINSAWIESEAHGHSGYLQLLVTLGGVGFVLAIVSLVVLPALEFWQRDPQSSQLRALLFALFVFAVFHNLLESDFLEGDGVVWVSFLMMLALLRSTSASEAWWRRA
ncbi:MAG: O-antigen ligase family protein [Proteobacteria bacterium]|nr:O-antigen ligase family protein [Pseudomonadota bacterium]